MVYVGLFLAVIVVGYVIVEYYNDKRREAKGICKTTGSTCTSPTGCTCSDSVEQHHH